MPITYCANEPAWAKLDWQWKVMSYEILSKSSRAFDIIS